MQLQALLVLAASAATGLAQNCTYKTADAESFCYMGDSGDSVFCTGNMHVCGDGKTDTFDEQATIANEDACAGVPASRGDSCVQTVACC